MFKYIRIAILLTILVVVAGNQLLTSNRFSSWEKTLWITIYPILAEPGDDIRRYAGSLKPDSFGQIGTFIGQQAARHGKQLEAPVVIQVAQSVICAHGDLIPGLTPYPFGLSFIWNKSTNGSLFSP